MTTEDLIARLRGYKGHSPCAEAADALEALGREVEGLKDRLESSVHGQNQTFDLCKMLEEERDTLRAELAELKNDVFSYKVAWETVCDGAKDVVSDLEKARAELAAIRAQEPVARVTGYYGGRAVVEALNPAAILPQNMALYASPAAKDAGLVADGWQPIETAPKREEVLLWATKHKSHAFIGFWDEYDIYNQPRITHWMPLPASPKIGGV